MRVAVVGGGAVGVTAALDLAVRDVNVTLYERERVGSGSTGRAAGVVYDAFAEDVDAALARRALARFRELSGEGEFRLRETPYVWFVTEPGARADAVREMGGRMREHGVGVELLDAGELRSRFPQLRTEDVRVAAVARDAGVADPGAYADLLAERASAAGATLREGSEAAVRTDPTRVRAGGGETPYDAVLVAAGAWTKRLLADAGVELPLKPYRVQALRCSGPAIPSFYDATEGYYARPTRRGLLAGDGTDLVEGDPEAYDREADESFVEGTLARLDERIVNLRTDVRRAWAGLCVATPDRDPLLGPVADGVYVAAGWQGSGFMRAPATAEAVVDRLLADGGLTRPAGRWRTEVDCPHPVDAFEPDRFDGDEEFDVREGMEIE